MAEVVGIRHLRRLHPRCNSAAELGSNHPCLKERGRAPIPDRGLFRLSGNTHNAAALFVMVRAAAVSAGMRVRARITGTITNERDEFWAAHGLNLWSISPATRM
jgi:hypothetical protein